MMKKLAGLFLVAFAMAVVGCGGPGKPEIPTDGKKMETDTKKMDEKSNAEKVTAPED